MSLVTNTVLPAQQWAEDDGSVIREYCKKVFLGKWERVNIITAVREKLKITDSLDVSETELKVIPKDFLLLKSFEKMTYPERQSRYENWEVLDYREEHEKTANTLPTPTWCREEFGLRLDDFKELIYKLAEPFIKVQFATEFNKEFPNVTIRNRPIRSIEDLIEFIHTYDPTSKASGNPALDEVRKMVYFSMYGNWGKSHYWAEVGELKTLAMLGMTYSGNKMASGKLQKRKQRGGCIKALFVKKLDMERNKINDAWQRVRLEKFFKRDVFKPAKNDQDTTATDGAEGSKKPRPDKSHLRKYLVFSKIAQGDKFDGSYLLLEGHPERARIDREAATASVVTNSASEDDEEGSLISSISRNFEGNDAKDLTKLMEGLQKSGQGQAFAALLTSLMGGKKRVSLEGPNPVTAPPPAKKPRADEPPRTPAGRELSLVNDGQSTVVSDVTKNTLDDCTANEPIDFDAAINAEEIMEASTGLIFEDIEFPQQQKAPVKSRGKTLKMPQQAAPKKAPREQQQPPKSPGKDKQTQPTEALRSSPRKSWIAPSTVMGPDGKEVPMFCSETHHGSPLLWTNYDSKFYNSSYRKTVKQGRICSHCVKCQKEFVAGNIPKGSLNTETQFKVTTNPAQMVWACPGAMKRTGGCNCILAFCAPCFGEVKEKIVVSEVVS